MGMLYYGWTHEPIEIPDRTLAHVKALVAVKLRRGECFMLSWHDDGPTRATHSVWVQPAIPLRFAFDGPEPRKLDARLLHDYSVAAYSTGGLEIELGGGAAFVDTSRLQRT